MEDNKKGFFSVFPEFDMGEKINALFRDTEIESITMYQGEGRLVIDMSSGHLIDKEIIDEAADCIKDILVPDRDVKVIINDRYNLSSLYTLEKLTEMYKESLFYEIEKMSHIDLRLMKKADWYYDENVITLAMDDTKTSRNRSVFIRDFLVNTYKNRFGMDIKVGFNYTEADKESLKKANEMKMKLEVEAILDSIGENEKSDEQKKTGSSGEIINFNEKKQSGVKNKKNTGTKRGLYQKKQNGRLYTYDPEVFYGRECEGEITDIKNLNEGSGEVCIRGQLINVEERTLKNNKFLFICAISDFTDTITFKIFASENDRQVYADELKQGDFYRLKGIADYDDYAKELCIKSIKGIKHIPDFRIPRKDTAATKRVELHMHTVMSEMDSVVDIEAVMKRASDWGHKAIAITDHGVVQAFPTAFHTKGLRDDFKIIYGVEGYFADDLKDLIIDSKNQPLNTTYVVFDIETTGLSVKHNKIIEIGAVKIESGEVLERFSEFINPEEPIPYQIEQLTSINDSMVENAPTIDEVLPKFLEFCGDSVVVAHNAVFDTGFIKKWSKELGLDFSNTILDTMTLSHMLLPELGRYTLDRLCKEFNIVNKHHHRAVDDAEATYKVFMRLYDKLTDKGIGTLDELNKLGTTSADIIKKARTYHGIILAKNEIGRINLYRLISESHINYYNRRPRMPMSLINKYREGLIIGSACESGELYQAIVNDASDEEISRIVNFFDYLEIQPLANNEFMLRKENSPYTWEDLKNFNRKIVELGEQFNKPVAATGDVHFLEPEDSVYRAIIMSSKGYDDAALQPPLYFRTTEEMLKEFEYLGSEKAYEVVVTNTNLIADMIEYIEPVRPDKAPPVIDNSDETLTKICYEKAHQIYGPKLPDIVVNRLEKELHSIISNGFAVMYIIAQKLVWDSNEHGYLVGSRGSVGSSFVATMAGITEVNPLPAHYICPKCHYVDFESDIVKANSGNSGCDLPDMDCPVCGTPLAKEGHDIPFETFLGFKGDKEPDIDLNFSGEYQANAHAYTEVLFGKGKAFRAGTIGTVAEKTAYGYVYNYFKDVEKEKLKKRAEELNLSPKEAQKYIEENVKVTKRNCEMERLACGCVGVKRTTGQHPGGMIVLPENEEIYSFTPIQKPANDVSTDIITSHFEYHSIDHNLLKLDILGHDDPTMIRRLEDLTGIDATTIRLDDSGVMSLFKGTEALNITPSDIDGVPLGSMGVPEFGTEFAMQMLIDAKPQNFSDLVRISGLAHGTDVWVGNAQDLIKSGQCTISTAICCRDDIMIYLIHMGLDSGMAFSIMESVRKGLVAKGKCDKWEQWKTIMKEHGVQDWYIGSCEKIKYMFPKAHAAAYVMMGWRVAWFKINYPLEYYTAFFSIRASGFSYELMCFGREKVLFHIHEITATDKSKRTAKDEDRLRDLRLVLEMYARGYEFMPIDIYVADDVNFKIIDGKIMPSLASIDGMGAKAAGQLKAAAADGKFLSREDLQTRAKIGKTTVEKMSELGILNDMPETNQLTFDFI